MEPKSTLKPLRFYATKNFQDVDEIRVGANKCHPCEVISKVMLELCEMKKNERRISWKWIWVIQHTEIQDKFLQTLRFLYEEMWKSEEIECRISVNGRLLFWLKAAVILEWKGFSL